MKNLPKCTTWIFVASITLSMTAIAEDSWRVRLGASFRTFDDIELADVALRNQGVTDPDNGPIGIQGYTDATFLGTGFAGPFASDHVVFSGADEGSDDVWSPVIGIERTLVTRDKLALSLVANVFYFTMDVDEDSAGTPAAPGDFTAQNYMHTATSGSGIADINTGPNDGFAGVTSVQVSHEFEMDLYVLDLGLKGAVHPCAHSEVFIAGGPTLTICDVETSYSESATWNTIPGTNDVAGAYASAKDKDDDTPVILGVYGAVGLGCRLSERLMLSAEVRYDLAFDKPETDHAEIDLDGISGIVSCSCSF